MAYIVCIQDGVYSSILNVFKQEREEEEGRDSSNASWNCFMLFEDSLKHWKN